MLRVKLYNAEVWSVWKLQMSGGQLSVSDLVVQYDGCNSGAKKVQWDRNCRRQYFALYRQKRLLRSLSVTALLLRVTSTELYRRSISSSQQKEKTLKNWNYFNNHLSDSWNVQIISFWSVNRNSTFSNCIQDEIVHGR